MRARVLPAVLAVLALGSAGVAAAPALRDHKVSPAAAADIATPVFSLRRVAGAVSRTIAADHLTADLDGVFAQPVLGSARDDTCLAVRDPAGRTIYARDTTRSLIPASTMKLLTATIALDRLGADTRYVTPVKAAAPPQDGAVGDLYLVGSGDPLLATADYAAQAGWMQTARPATSIEGLADRVFNAGVRRVGRVVGDESRYDRQRYLPSWEPNYATDPDVGPESALNVNDGYAAFKPRYVPSSAPAASAAATFADLLRARGITVGGTAEGTAPPNAVTVAQIESPPMSEIVGEVLRDSDNIGAELLVKELGARVKGAGSTAAGLDVIRATAATLGLPVDVYAGADGSGLDRSDRLSCDFLQQVLGRSGVQGTLASGMSVAGSNGTLLKRFLTTPAAGKVRAKTGSLSEVSGLAGWTTATDGTALQFSLLANDLPTEATGTALQDKVVSALAGYPKAPAPDELGPLPAKPRAA